MLINQDNFLDDKLPSADLIIDTNLQKSWTVTYTITLADDSTDATNQTYFFLRSVEQIGFVSNKLLTVQHLLNLPTLTMWLGYPFDIARFSEGDVTVRNLDTTGFKLLTSVDNNTERIWLSRGDSVITGTGTIIEKSIANMRLDGVTDVDFTLKIVDTGCDGTYLKWINEFGTWSYWLFNPIHVESINPKSADIFNLDFESIDNTYQTMLAIGKKTDKQRKITAKNLSTEEALQLQSMFLSPRVELYNGSYGDAVTSASWQTVLVSDGRLVTSNTKKLLNNMSATIMMKQYTQF